MPRSNLRATTTSSTTTSSPSTGLKEEHLMKNISPSVSRSVPTLNWNVTECVPKLASNWVLILTAGGLPVAFCTTRKSLVTISMTWPVWKTKSPFLLTASEERQPGMLGWLLNSRVGEDWKALCEVWEVLGGNNVCLTALTWNTAMSSKNGLKDNLNISAAGTLQLR